MFVRTIEFLYISSGSFPPDAAARAVDLSLRRASGVPQIDKLRAVFSIWDVGPYAV